MAKSLKKIVFEELKVKTHEGEKALSVDDAKKLIGWRAENDPKEDKAFGTDYKLKDRDGIKIRLENCETNRPFRLGLSLLYANEILRGKWRFSPDAIAFDVRNNCQSGQHRLVGLILAEQMRKKDPEPWKAYGTKGPVTLECMVLTGLDDSDETVDAIDIGQRRSLGDVLFRNRSFEGPDGKMLTEKEQQGLTNVLANASRVVWLCLGGKLVSDAPKFLHSEALDLIEAHPKLLDAVSHVTIEDAGSEKQIRKYCSLGTAAGLMYLMAASKTNTKKWENGEAEVDFSHWEKAEEFWTLVASGASLEKGHPCLVLRNFLAGSTASGGHERDAITAAIKLAWNAFIEEKKLDGTKALKASHEKVKDKSVMVMPYMGGLDVHHEAPPAPPKEKKPTKEEKAAAKKAAAESKKAVKAAGKKAPKAIGKKGKPAKQNVSYQFTAGDEVYVLPSGNDDEGKPYELYKGRVAEIKTDGKVIVVPEGMKTECELNPEEGDYVGLKKPGKTSAA